MNSERISTNSKMKPRRLFKKEICEVKKTAQDVKESLTKLWKVSEKRIKQKYWK
jgi:hypothetical protein